SPGLCRLKQTSGRFSQSSALIVTTRQPDSCNRCAIFSVIKPLPPASMPLIPTRTACSADLSVRVPTILEARRSSWFNIDRLPCRRVQPSACRLDRRSGLARFSPSGKGGRLIGPSIARKQNRSRPKVALIRHITLRQLQYDEIVTQFASAVFAAFHVRFEIVSEQCDVQRQRPRLHGVRSESGADLTIVAYCHTQHANFSGRDRHRIAAKPAAPFLAVDDKTRSVNRVAAPSRGITQLS